ncbi:MAG: hypothetical protein U1F77_10715 [Kiritimatiellia bacterium]
MVPANTGRHLRRLPHHRGLRGRSSRATATSSPSPACKFGPSGLLSTWHHQYSDLQTRSEFCATCHNAHNRNGLEIKSTFTEWKASVYAEKGIQCQDCHMNEKGFLEKGLADFASGKSASMTVGHAPQRDRIYAHHFPGARTQTQMEGALKLKIEPPATPVRAGTSVEIGLLVDNVLTGHKMPSGSAELRYMWIEFQSGGTDGRSLDLVPLSAPESKGYDVSSARPAPEDPLGTSVPAGRRVYRAVFTDRKGRMTGSLLEAARVLFDNRLNAAEVRREAYTLAVPHEAKGDLALTASLYYAPYPLSFAKRLDLPAAKPVLVARTGIQLRVEAAKAP